MRTIKDKKVDLSEYIKVGVTLRLRLSGRGEDGD
jgi:hypothetical protein